jgi:hypothetical protein
MIEVSRGTVRWDECWSSDKSIYFDRVDLFQIIVVSLGLSAVIIGEDVGKRDE